MMPTDTVTIQEGMDVLSSDGARIGKVKEVWADARLVGPPDPDDIDRYTYGITDATGRGAVSGEHTVDNTPPPGTVLMPEHFTSSAAIDRRYFRVERGGILRGGASQYYFPFSAVAGGVPGKSVTLNCAEHECIDRYRIWSSFLDRESNEERS